MSSGSTIERVVRGDLSLGVYRSQLGWSETPPSNAIMLSGSFRPLHRAHRALLNSGLRVICKGLDTLFRDFSEKRGKTRYRSCRFRSTNRSVLRTERYRCRHAGGHVLGEGTSHARHHLRDRVRHRDQAVRRPVLRRLEGNFIKHSPQWAKSRHLVQVSWLEDDTTRMGISRRCETSTCRQALIRF